MPMRQTIRWGTGLGILLWVGLSMASAQRLLGGGYLASGATASISSTSNLDLPKLVAEDQVVREIDDPSIGRRWLVVRDASHPGGPGKLVVVPGPVPQRRVVGNQRSVATGANAPRKTPALPLIQRGERITVEEHTAVADVQLVAIALHPANLGETFEVRLMLGGSVLRARAMGPRSAALMAEVQP